LSTIKRPAKPARAPLLKKAKAKPLTAKSPVKKTANKPAARKAAVKKTAVKKAPVKKAPIKKVSKPAAPKKAASTKAALKTPVAKKATTKPVAKAPSSISSAAPKGRRTATSSSRVAVGQVAKVPSLQKTVVSPTQKKSVLKKEENTESSSFPRPVGKLARAVFRDPSTIATPPVRKPLPSAVPAPTVSAPDLNSDWDPGFLDSSEVFDEAEHAQHQQLREMASIQERARAMARPETHPDFDGEHCVDCDDDIPEFRLKIGRVRCVECQQVLENKDRQKGSGLPQGAMPRLPGDWQM
jgi:RNA polymerase-binding transcription factor DksA